MKYIASEGKVWDFREPHYYWDPERQEEIQVHLYVKALYVGITDSIDNYIEVDDPNNPV